MASATLLSLLLLFVLVAVAAERARITPTVLLCDPAAAQAVTSNASANATAYRANVLSLLGALPSAAARTGFASLRSAGRDRAFARGLCFGDAAPSRCRACLSAAARNLTDGCGADRVLAGLWTDGCFASYSAANASSPSYVGFRARVISDAAPLAREASYELHSLADLAWRLAPFAAADAMMRADGVWTAVAGDHSMNTTVRVLAQCARDRTPAECAGCLQYSSRAAETCCWDLGAWRDGVAAAVAGFDCYLRFEVATATLRRVRLLQRIGKVMSDHPVLTGVVCVVVGALAAAAFCALIQAIFCWMTKIGGRNNAAVAAVPAPAAGRVRVEMNPRRGTATI